MAKQKHNSKNTPKRKRYNQKNRLQNAKKWIEQYDRNNLAKCYSKWFGVDLVCAITELEMLGYKFEQSYKDQVKRTLESRHKQKEKRKQEKEQVKDEWDNMFYFVAGYTENGFPFGITKEEMEEDKQNITKSKNYTSIMLDNELPF
ncbi:hypothetical protein [Neobacillus cucumis]|uniref:hypothetical protein n=1 Tax=Neobacillus cucumis TaxID=1740721 RepID=UPI001962BD88|nr:hypothetical protein [Neobacillus cucumis]MBM7653498.1 hypothetical protein [Neobacillus cucumis]